MHVAFAVPLVLAGTLLAPRLTSAADEGAPREVVLSAVPFAAARPDSVRMLFTGLHRSVQEWAIAEGEWQTHSDGRSVWRLAVRSPGALGVRLELTACDLGTGTLHVSNGGRASEEVARYTGRGPFDDGHFWTATVFGDRIQMEYEPAEGREARGFPPFRIGRLSHQYRSITDGGTAQEAGSGEQQAGTCNLDPNCHPEWLETANSVGMILFETDAGQALCSGSLVRTRSDSRLPYFLTANHCIDSPEAARTVEAFWGYRTDRCGGEAPSVRSLERSPVGARYLVSKPSEDADFSLILLPSVPKSAVFADWDPAELDIHTPVTGIHHPRGSFERISFGEVTLPYWSVDYTDVPYQIYYQVLWKSGIVEPGSSGSPLFTDNHKLTGVLSYGFLTRDLCDTRPSMAGYGRFSAMYGDLAPYLDDQAAQQLSLTPAAMAFVVENARSAIASKTFIVRSSSNDPARFTAAVDVPWLSVSSSEGTTSNSHSEPIEVRVRPELLSRSGWFNGSVTVKSAGAEKRIPVTAQVTVIPSSVTVSVSPQPVEAKAADADGCRWFFTLRLEESAGVSTRLTRVRMNGDDYTAYAGSWFGTTVIPAGGAVEAQLRSCGPGGSGPQILDFAGVDADTRLAWSQALTVEFR